MKGFSLSIDAHPDEETIFRYARKYQLSFYDATYLKLAHRNGVALATLDKALAAAAKAAGVALLV